MDKTERILVSIITVLVMVFIFAHLADVKW